MTVNAYKHGISVKREGQVIYILPFFTQVTILPITINVLEITDFSSANDDDNSSHKIKHYELYFGCITADNIQEQWVIPSRNDRTDVLAVSLKEVLTGHHNYCIQISLDSSSSSSALLSFKINKDGDTAGALHMKKLDVLPSNLRILESVFLCYEETLNKNHFLLAELNRSLKFDAQLHDSMESLVRETITMKTKLLRAGARLIATKNARIAEFEQTLENLKAELDIDLHNSDTTYNPTDTYPLKYQKNISTLRQATASYTSPINADINVDRLENNNAEIIRSNTPLIGKSQQCQVLLGKGSCSKTSGDNIDHRNEVKHRGNAKSTPNQPILQLRNTFAECYASSRKDIDIDDDLTDFEIKDSERSSIVTPSLKSRDNNHTVRKYKPGDHLGSSFGNYDVRDSYNAGSPMIYNIDHSVGNLIKKNQDCCSSHADGSGSSDSDATHFDVNDLLCDSDATDFDEDELK
ncbi:unnamed protein product [Allacma fusca]|uniref:Uncharacterized protein n=1 Tax=Allacma fusca TaxID=39272 RepID=A0A8J2JGL3_9HEXA|nr:unnamed protein product [Allacma fusca]